MGTSPQKFYCVGAIPAHLFASSGIAWVYETGIKLYITDELTASLSVSVFPITSIGGSIIQILQAKQYQRVHTLQPVTLSFHGDCIQL